MTTPRPLPEIITELTACEVCGKEDAVGHHEDYSKPYDVRWLCHTHHMEVHRIAEH